MPVSKTTMVEGIGGPSPPPAIRRDLGLGLQVGQVDVAVGIAGHRHHLEEQPSTALAGLCHGRWWGSGRLARALAAAAVPRPGSTRKAGIFPLGPGIGCSRHPGKSPLQAPAHTSRSPPALRSQGLAGRAKGVGSSANLRPSSRAPARAAALSFIVQLPSGINACTQREVFRDQPLDCKRSS